MCDLPTPIPYLIASLKQLRWGESINATEYRLEISRDSGETWTAVAKAIKATTVVLPKLIERSNYAFRVRGYNTCGFGDYSPIAYRFAPKESDYLAFSWTTPPRVEPNLQDGINTSWTTTIGPSIMDINEQSVVKFKTGTVVNGILVISKENVTYEENESGVIFKIPQNSIILGDGGIKYEEQKAQIGIEEVVVSKKSATKTFIEDISGITYVMNGTDMEGFSKAGFSTATIEDGLSVQVLRKKKLVNEKGIFQFRLTHIVNGTGYAKVSLSTSTSELTPPYVPILSRLVVGPQMTATQVGNNVNISWVSLSNVSNLWRKINNGPWMLVTKLNAEESFRTDYGVRAGAVYCYSVGFSPNPNITACVFIKSI